MQLGYKQYLLDTRLVPDDGYFCHYGYHTFIDDTKEFCCEVDIINKIKYNEDKYFDFSKSMIDIGSDIGTYSFILPFSYHYMFEGNREKCIIAQFNMLLKNKEYQFEQYTTLLSDKNEEITYNGFETQYSYDSKIDGIKMMSTRLDDYNLENIGFIKVDVEGMELKVLKGAISTIKRNKYPPILFELWPVGYNGMTEKRHAALEHFITELGYEILWEWGQFDTHLAIHK